MRMDALNQRFGKSILFKEKKMVQTREMVLAKIVSKIIFFNFKEACKLVITSSYQIYHFHN